MGDKLLLANFIFSISTYKKINKDDIKFAIKIFTETEEYEKCSFLVKLKSNKKTTSYYNLYLSTMKGRYIINNISKNDEDDGRVNKLVKRQKKNEKIFWKTLDKTLKLWEGNKTKKIL